MPNIYAFHGFLGHPSDWNAIAWPASHRLLPIDLYNASLSEPNAGLKEWANSFYQQYPAQEGDILVGYSLGARLAMHCLRACPKRWRGAILISTHPGLQTVAEKETRLADDESWARAFETEPWDALMHRWNQQSIFAGHAFFRAESEYKRQKLADTLRGWSLAKQGDFRPFLNKLECPILWVSGKRDLKFCDLSLTVNLAHLFSTKAIIPDVGHRTLFERPDLFQPILTAFFRYYS